MMVSRDSSCEVGEANSPIATQLAPGDFGDLITIEMKDSLREIDHYIKILMEAAKRCYLGQPKMFCFATPRGRRLQNQTILIQHNRLYPSAGYL